MVLHKSELMLKTGWKTNEEKMGEKKQNTGHISIEISTNSNRLRASYMKLQLKCDFFLSSVEKQDAFSTFHAFKRVNNHLSPKKSTLKRKKREDSRLMCIFPNTNCIRLTIPIRWRNWEWNEKMIFFEFLSLSSNDGFIINSKFNKL